MNARGTRNFLAALRKKLLYKEGGGGGDSIFEKSFDFFFSPLVWRESEKND